MRAEANHIVQPFSELLAVLLGFLGVGMGNILGWITVSSFASAIVLGAAGSAGGYLMKLLLDYVIKKFKKSNIKKSTSK